MKKIAGNRNYEIIKNANPMITVGPWLGAAWAVFTSMFDGGRKVLNSISKDVFDEEADELYKKWYNKLKTTDLITGSGTFPAGHSFGGVFMRNFVHQKWLNKEKMTEEQFENAFEDYYGESAKGVIQFGLDNEEGWVESFNLIVEIKKGQDAAKAAGRDWRQKRPSFEESGEKNAETKSFEMKKIASDLNYEIVNTKKIASNANYKMFKRANPHELARHRKEILGLIKNLEDVGGFKYGQMKYLNKIKELLFYDKPKIGPNDEEIKFKRAVEDALEFWMLDHDGDLNSEIPRVAETYNQLLAFYATHNFESKYDIDNLLTMYPEQPKPKEVTVKALRAGRELAKALSAFSQLSFRK